MKSVKASGTTTSSTLTMPMGMPCSVGRTDRAGAFAGEQLLSIGGAMAGGEHRERLASRLRRRDHGEACGELGEHGQVDAAKRTKAIARSAETAHSKAECALRDHPSLGRYVRLTPTGRLRSDRQKVAAEERLDALAAGEAGEDLGPLARS
jgi:hypothetical protein